VRRAKGETSSIQHFVHHFIHHFVGRALDNAGGRGAFCSDDAMEQSESASSPKSDERGARVLLIGLAIVSLAPISAHAFLTFYGMFEIRGPGGLHPADLLMLRWVGQFSFLLPFFVVVALTVSLFSVTTTRLLLSLLTAGFLCYLAVYLLVAVITLTFWHSPLPLK
jgi:hypothetical protein